MEAAWVLGVLAAVVLSLALTRYPADVLLFAALVLLLIVPVPGDQGLPTPWCRLPRRPSLTAGTANSPTTAHPRCCRLGGMVPKAF